MKLGNFLVKARVLKRAQLDEALQHQVLHGARLGTCLVELGMISIDTLAQQLAQFHGVPVPGRQQLEKVAPAAARRLTRALVEKRRVLPLKLEGTSALHVAMLDPHDPATLDDLRFVARARIVPYVLPELVMHDWLDWLFQVPRTLRYVDLSQKKSAPVPQPREVVAPRAAGPGTLRGVGKDGLDMGRWEGGAQPSEVRKQKSGAAFSATLPGAQRPPVAHDMADALKQVVPMTPEPALPSVLSVAPPAPPSALSAPPPRDTRPPPALVLPEATPVAARAKRPGGGTLPGAGGVKQTVGSKVGKSKAPPAMPSPAPQAAPEPPAAAVAPAASERPANVGLATWAVALEAAVIEAQDREALVDAALRLGGLYAEAFAVFAVHRGMVQGVRGLGPGGEIDGLTGILIDEATTCQLTAPVASGEALRFVLEERSVEERILHVMGRQAVREAAVFPVRLRQRTVSLLYADNGAEALPRSCFGALEQVAQCMAAGYEQLILRRRGT